MAELVDAHGSGPCSARSGGSSPLLGTISSRLPTGSIQKSAMPFGKASLHGSAGRPYLSLSPRPLGEPSPPPLPFPLLPFFPLPGGAGGSGGEGGSGGSGGDGVLAVPAGADCADRDFSFEAASWH